MNEQVFDDGDLRRYRTELPNLIDDADLSPFAYRLYGHLKRRAGDAGYCNEGVRPMAEHCKMSPASVVNAKRELEAKGLIRIKPGDKTKSVPDTITITNIWQRNFKHFDEMRAKKSLPCSPNEHPVHETAAPCSPNEHPVHEVVHKKEPVKKEPKKEEEGSRAVARSPYPLISELQKNPAYRQINVEGEFYKMLAWCDANQKQATRRRFVNWLNRIDVLAPPNGHQPPDKPDAAERQKQLEERYRGNLRPPAAAQR